MGIFSEEFRDGLAPKMATSDNEVETRVHYLRTLRRSLFGAFGGKEMIYSAFIFSWMYLTISSVEAPG
jgi:hypothetical protein